MRAEASDYDRIGAYAVILSPDALVLLVEANGGRLYLPGGRSEAGETPEDALLREIMEECGCAAAISGKLGEAIQPIFEGRSSILAHYYQAEVGRFATRGEHTTLWLPANKAMCLVHRRGDSQAIRTAVQRRGAGPSLSSYARVA